MSAQNTSKPNQTFLESLVLRIYEETKIAWSKYSNDNDYIRNHGYWVMVGPPETRPPVFIVSSIRRINKINADAQH